MNRRLALGLVGLAVLLAAAGCVNPLGGGTPDAGELAANETYTWNNSVDATLGVNSDNVTAVYAISNRTTGEFEDEDPTMEFYARGLLGEEKPETLTAVQFQYPDGTHITFESRNDTAVPVVTYPNGTTTETDSFSVEKGRDRTIVHLPANTTGKLAVTLPKSEKQVTLPAYVEGSYQMSLPPRARVDVPLLSQVRPAADTTTLTDDGVVLEWTQLSTPSISVRYYLDRDLLLFGGLFLGAITIGLAGAFYYLRQVRDARRKRESVGLDVDTGDDEREGPPPGMR